MQKIVIAIDGYSSCGKSTVAKEIAKKLNYIYIDSGAMYRAVTYFCLKNKIIDNGIVNETILAKKLSEIHIKFEINATSKKVETILNGENIEEEIRKIEVSSNVSNVSKIKFVREHLVHLQQEMGKEKGIVMDGRDIGTVVFPTAEVKIFMTADPKVRAKRRFDELIAKGEKISMEEIIENIESRDLIDTTRKESPLRKADDAIILDNSNITHTEQLEKALEIIKQKLK